MHDADLAINEIKALERRRHQGMIDGDTTVLDELCSVDLIHTHFTTTSGAVSKSRLPLLRPPRDHASGGSEKR